MEINTEQHFINKFGLVDPILGKSDYRIGYESGFIKGAKSEAAKEYWIKKFKEETK